jgi:hypothetical protein
MFHPWRRNRRLRTTRRPGLTPARDLTDERHGRCQLRLFQHPRSRSSTGDQLPLPPDWPRPLKEVEQIQHLDLVDAMRTVMKQPRAQAAFAHRQGSVEPVFGELRHTQGLNRFARSGLPKVTTEFALHAMAHNVRRFLIAALRPRRRDESRRSRPLRHDLAVLSHARRLWRLCSARQKAINIFI